MFGLKLLIGALALATTVTPAFASPVCTIDSDCPVGNWCQESTGACMLALANGAPIPVDPPHTNPTLNGTCTTLAGVLVCASGVCDVADNACGYLDGDGVCTQGNASVVCRSGLCNLQNKCGADPTTTTTTPTTTTTTTTLRSGFVPPDVTTAKCEAAVAKAAAVAWSSIAKCHAKAATAALANKPYDQNGCEAAATAKFDATTSRLKGCPVCLTPNAIRAFVQNTSNGSNGMFYCAGTTPFP